jgi:cobalt-zinc-cadmium efflux system membrane fusion protein
MKIKNILYAAFSALLIASCGQSETTGPAEKQSEASPEMKAAQTIHLSQKQFKSLGIKLGKAEHRSLSSFVEANGRLEVPPQNEAMVTAIIGANVTRIMVIEGEKIKKGQALAYLIHPDLIKLQTDYIDMWNELEYLEQEYERQKRLYEEEVGSGKAYQKVKGQYQSKKGMVKGYEAQLELMGLNAQRILDGNLYEQVPVVSPIDGYIRKVRIKTGQYVQPQTEMFDVVNIDHIHADLMVYEKDVHKVSEGQKVVFSLESHGDKELQATIYAVGKSFEEDPKAVHIHAEISNKEGLLIPGMYIRGKIVTNETQALALPEGAVVREVDRYYVFAAEKSGEEWNFTPHEIRTGSKDAGWIEVEFLEEGMDTMHWSLNNAYYLMAELEKEEAGHVH